MLIGYARVSTSEQNLFLIWSGVADLIYSGQLGNVLVVDLDSCFPFSDADDVTFFDLVSLAILFSFYRSNMEFT